jgi:hypothetical protein
MGNSLNVVHGLNGGISLGLLGEANEAEAATTTGIAILNHDLGQASD